MRGLPGETVYAAAAAAAAGQFCLYANLAAPEFARRSKENAPSSIATVQRFAA